LRLGSDLRHQITMAITMITRSSIYPSLSV
jgi:hypothetical protein